MGVKRPFEEEEFPEFPLKLSKQFDQDKEIPCDEEDFPSSVTSPKTDFSGELKVDFYKLHSDGRFDNGHTNGAPVADNELETSTLLSWATSSSSEDNMGMEDATFGSYFPADFDFSLPHPPPMQFENPYFSLLNFSPRKDVPIGPDHQAEVLPWGVNPTEIDCLGHGDTVNCTENRPTGTCIVQMPRDSTTESSLLGFHRKEVPIGPDHQAEVPRWDMNVTRKDYVGSDIWERRVMGACIIPIPDYSAIDGVSVGHGRTDCSCLDSGSMKCVRQHVMEAREALRETIGDDNFTELGFYDMGEELACKWTADDEHLFHGIIFSNPMSLGRNFWKHLSAAFPTRTKKEIVSYYFNVFMLRRRAIQNRSLLLDIDSDDDEWESTHGDFYHNRSNLDDSDMDGEYDTDHDNDNEEQGAYENFYDDRSNKLYLDMDGDNYGHCAGGITSPCGELYKVSREDENPEVELFRNQD